MTKKELTKKNYDIVAIIVLFVGFKGICVDEIKKKREKGEKYKIKSFEHVFRKSGARHCAESMRQISQK